MKRLSYAALEELYNEAREGESIASQCARALALGHVSKWIKAGRFRVAVAFPMHPSGGYLIARQDFSSPTQDPLVSFHYLDNWCAERRRLAEVLGVSGHDGTERMQLADLATQAKLIQYKANHTVTQGAAHE